MVVNGPFKAFLTAIALKANLHDDSREARFYFCILAEPKWKDFQYQNPALVTAQDDRSRSYSRGPQGGPQDYWNGSRSNLMDFDNDWGAVKVSGLSARAATLTDLSIEVPVRIIHTTRQCRFENVKPESPITKSVGDRTFKLKEFGIDSRTVRACISVAGVQGLGMTSYKFALEKGGREIGFLQMQTATTSKTGAEYRLEGQVQERITPGESCDLVVRFPGKTTDRKFRFDFKDLKLPYPVKRVKL